MGFTSPTECEGAGRHNARSPCFAHRSARLLRRLQRLRRLHAGVFLVPLELEPRGVEPDLGFLVRLEAGARRDQVAQDDVLLEADEVIDLAGQPIPLLFRCRSSPGRGWPAPLRGTWPVILAD